MPPLPASPLAPASTPFPGSRLRPGQRGRFWFEKGTCHTWTPDRGENGVCSIS